MWEAQVLMAKMYSAKLTPNLKAASRLLIPFLKNPIGQVVISFGLGYFVTTRLSQVYTKLKRNYSKSQSDNSVDMESSSKDDKEVLLKESELILLSIQQLAAFDGLNPDQPVYTALNGKIYDLSPGREKFSNLGPYSHLAGCDANKVLNIECYLMDVCADDLINRWEQSLKAEFNVVGYLIDTDMESKSEDVEIRDTNDKKKSHTDDNDGGH